MQGDGNLVLYQNGSALWTSNTSGQNCSTNQCNAVFQGDGNFVVYNGSTPLWNSQTGGNLGAQLVLSGQAPYLEIIGSNQSILWAAFYTISGQVTANGSPLSGVTISLTGTRSFSTTTDSNGNYSFSVPAGGSYTVTPSLAAYTFSPASQTFSNMSANQTANFSGATSTLSISGQVLLNGSALSGVTVTLSGSTSGSVTTSSNGMFSFSVQSGGDYTIVPSRSGYKFNPASSTYNGLTGNQTTTFAASSGSSGSIPVPPPPTACTNCGLSYADTGSGANPQTVFAPNSSNTLYAYCENPSNGQVVACNISLSTTYYQYTNGHFHGNPAAAQPITETTRGIIT
jgi:inhibitor of cysteine peptidase